MNSEAENSRDYQRIEQALTFVAENFRQQPTLPEIAAAVHLSEHHFQRMFQRWAGVSPKQFLQYLTVSHAGDSLRAGMSGMDAAYDVGLSAPARLSELFVRLEALTPGEYKSGGAGVEVACGWHQTPFGECVIGVTKRGVCGLQFITGNASRENALDAMQGRLPNAAYHHSQENTAAVVSQIFSSTSAAPLPLLVCLLYTSPSPRDS